MSTDDLKNEKNEKIESLETKDLSKMSDDGIKWRAKYKMTKSELEESKLAAEKEKSDLLMKVETSSKEKQKLEQKVIDAELKAQAVSLGIKDLDFIKLIDTKNVKLNNEGVVEGLEQVVQDFKTRKPDLFGVEKKTSTSSNAPAGNSSNSAGRVDARTMSNDDWKKNRNKYMSGNFN